MNCLDRIKGLLFGALAEVPSDVAEVIQIMLKSILVCGEYRADHACREYLKWAETSTDKVVQTRFKGPSDEYLARLVAGSAPHQMLARAIPLALIADSAAMEQDLDIVTHVKPQRELAKMWFDMLGLALDGHNLAEILDWVLSCRTNLVSAVLMTLGVDAPLAPEERAAWVTVTALMSFTDFGEMTAWARAHDPVAGAVVGAIMGAAFGYERLHAANPEAQEAAVVGTKNQEPRTDFNMMTQHIYELVMCSQAPAS